MDAKTIITAVTFGIKCNATVLNVLAPIVLHDSMYGISITDSAAPRTVLATLGIKTIASAITTFIMLCPTTDTIANAKISRGNANMASITR